MSKGKNIALALAIWLTVILMGLLIPGCPLPLPPPVPGPSPSVSDASVPDAGSLQPDPFREKIFNCRLPIVAAQYTVASPRVGACLTSPPLACLSGLLTDYDPATVACLVRDLGSLANSAVLAGTASGNDGTVATNARVFINAEDLGFQ